MPRKRPRPDGRGGRLRGCSAAKLPMADASRNKDERWTGPTLDARTINVRRCSRRCGRRCRAGRERRQGLDPQRDRREHMARSGGSAAFTSARESDVSVDTIECGCRETATWLAKTFARRSPCTWGGRRTTSPATSRCRADRCAQGPHGRPCATRFRSREPGRLHRVAGRGVPSKRRGLHPRCAAPIL